MRYKVLWIDDEYKKQLDFIGEAEQEGIDITAFESHDEGIMDLNTKIDHYHAVILDAKVKKGKNDTIIGLRGFTASRDRLIEINNSSYLPYFIFTGQPDYANAEWFKETYGQYYLKALDNEKLFKDLKEAIAKKKEYQVQKKYHTVFEVCSNKYIGQEASKYLLEVLMSAEFPTEKFNDEIYFNGLRKLIELVFRSSNRLGLLHDKCIPNGIVNLTWCSIFMAGKEFELKPSAEKVGCSKAHFPLILSNNIKSALDITSAASHTEEERENGKVNFSEYKSRIVSNYLLYSLTFQVMDLLLWFRKYADENPDIEINRSHWKSYPVLSQNGDWITGQVTKITDTGWGTFKPQSGISTISILPKMIKDYSLAENMIILVRVEPSPDGLKKHIKEIKIV